MSAPTAVQRAPIFVMSFNRPGYLRRVLESLKAQVGCNIDERQIVLFQDGAINPYSNKRHASDGEISECVAVFKELFPDQLVKKADANLGVGLHFDRAEIFGFEKLGVDAAIFLEDDLVLGRHYIATLDRLVASFAEDQRVGYVAAYGDHTKPLQDQQKNAHRLIGLTHNWGFALFRRQWLEMRPRVLQYLQLIRDVDYRDKDANAIRLLFASWGFGCPAISQDAAKTIACCGDGVVKINTYVCNAVYIGEHGMHMNPALFRERGYPQTQLYPTAAESFEVLDDRLYRALLNEQVNWARGSLKTDVLATPSRPAGRGASSSSPEHLITAAYRGLLQRDPDRGGLQTYLNLFNGRPAEEALQLTIERLLKSAEFGRRWDRAERPEPESLTRGSKRTATDTLSQERAETRPHRRYIFVAGCGHTGTSVIAAMLGRHAEIFTIPRETSAFERFSTRDEVLRFLGMSDNPEAGDSRFVCEKTPAHLYKVERILTLFPDAKVILMVRDGRDVAASLFRRTGELGPSVEQWVKDTRETLKWRNHLSVHILTYEELVQNPEAALKRVCAFLGVAFDKAMLSFHEDPRPWFGETKIELPTGAGEERHRANRNWQIHQPLFDGRGKWRESLSDSDVETFDRTARGLMKELGYYGPVTAPLAPAAAAIAEKIFGGDVLGLYTPQLPADLQGWNSDHPIFPKLISKK